MKINQVFFIALGFLLNISFEMQAGGVKHSKTKTFKVLGNCGMCKKTIETAANIKGSANAIWDESKQILSLTFDSTKTSADEVLKRVAYAGYDNEKFLAPDEAYSKLHGCCQYERSALAKADGKAIAKTENGPTAMPGMDMAKMNDAKVPASEPNPLSAVFTSYFGLKDALTKDDGELAGTKAKEMFKAIDKVSMDKMTPPQHTLWMKLEKDISYDAEHIKGVSETEHQREHFIRLSENMYALAKVFKLEQPVYYDHCPMTNNGKGANWLSLEQKISNPYQGKKMLTCGKVQETIK